MLHMLRLSKTLLVFLVIFLLSVTHLGAESNESGGANVETLAVASKDKPLAKSRDQLIEDKLIKAQNLSDSKTDRVRPTSIGVKAWSRMILSLLAIVLLIFGLAWLSRKLQVNRITQTNDIKVLSTLALSHKEKLITVQVENQRLLLAISPSGINKLSRLDDVSVTKSNEPSQTD